MDRALLWGLTALKPFNEQLSINIVHAAHAPVVHVRGCARPSRAQKQRLFFIGTPLTQA